jgi:uncharacterized protein
MTTAEKRYLISFTLLSLFNWASPALSQENCFPVKDKSRLVYDGTDLLSMEEENLLERKLSEFARTTSNQIVIAVVPDLCGMDRGQYAIELGHTWGVGQAEQDNGIVVLVKPTGNKNDRHVFIAVGYGLEGIIPDATADVIVRHEILPNFREGKFYAGLDKATTVLMDLAKQEYSFEVYSAEKNKVQWAGPLIVAFIFLIVFLVFAFRAKRYASMNGIDLWTAFWLLSNTGRSHGGSWRSFSGGSGSFGGGSGFGGFGGGGFGGGGAGGSW